MRVFAATVVLALAAPVPWLRIVKLTNSEAPRRRRRWERQCWSGRSACATQSLQRAHGPSGHGWFLLWF